MAGVSLTPRAAPVLSWGCPSVTALGPTWPLSCRVPWRNLPWGRWGSAAPILHILAVRGGQPLLSPAPSWGCVQGSTGCSAPGP